MRYGNLSSCGASVQVGARTPLSKFLDHARTRAHTHICSTRFSIFSLHFAHRVLREPTCMCSI